MASPFLTLPMDVVGLFKGMFSMRDAKQLRLTSPIFADMFAPEVLHTLTVDFTAQTYKRELHILQLLASGQARSMRHAKSLKIRSLTTRKVVQGVDRHSMSAYIPEDVAPSEEGLKEFFLSGLSQLETVESVSWTPQPFYEKSWAYDNMKQLLITLPNLRHFTISLYYLTNYVPESPPFPPTPLHIPIEDMTTLRSIKLTGIQSTLS
ncbi:hypothetical protein BJ165DRAFT_1487409 [Panaeolus papilionaceus]|nr:hypothetical protein BJ165DRAFT_1487409 [Panaeolus papilionaceus]